MLKHKVEEHVLKSTSLKLNADSSRPELRYMCLFVLFHVIKEMVHGVVDTLGKLSEVDDNAML